MLEAFHGLVRPARIRSGSSTGRVGYCWTARAAPPRPPFPAGSVYAGWGASHFAELWYVFDHLNQATWGWTPADTVLADAMSTYWTNFAKTGDPNGIGVATWPAFGGSKAVLYIGDKIRVGGVPHRATLGAFDTVYAGIRGARVPETQ